MSDARNQAERILRLLEEKTVVSNIELNKICYRYGARIFELRQAGHDIERKYVKPGVYNYRLIPAAIQMELL